MIIPFYKKSPIKLKPEFIRTVANNQILCVESQDVLLNGPMSYTVITGGITADHPLLKFGNKKIGNKKHSNKTNK